MREQKPFRAFVPLLLNGRVVQWYYATGETKTRLEVPVRRYTKGGDGWIPKRIVVEFVRQSRPHNPFFKTAKEKSDGRVMEWYYTCDNPAITFENETIPRVVE